MGELRLAFVQRYANDVSEIIEITAREGFERKHFDELEDKTNEKTNIVAMRHFRTIINVQGKLET